MGGRGKPRRAVRRLAAIEAVARRAANRRTFERAWREAVERLHGRRRGLLAIGWMGATRDAEQDAELAAVEAQIDVLQGAEAIVFGRFDWQHERSKDMAGIARELYATAERLEAAVGGDAWEKLEKKAQEIGCSGSSAANEAAKQEQEPGGVP